MSWYLEALKKYAVFSGRARRKEYWMFVLINLIIVLLLVLVEGVFGGPGALAGLYQLAILVPSLAVSVRRLHDTDRSGWWLLIGFIPIIGGIVLLIFTVMDSDPGTNQYGLNPKAVTASPLSAACEYPKCIEIWQFLSNYPHSTKPSDKRCQPNARRGRSWSWILFVTLPALQGEAVEIPHVPLFPLPGRCSHEIELS